MGHVNATCPTFALSVLECFFSGGYVSVGRRSRHSGLTLILLDFSSYVIMSCIDRNFENSVNLSVCTLIWLDRCVMLCHFPSFMVAKSF
jgi:hypothetical protein